MTCINGRIGYSAGTICFPDIYKIRAGEQIFLFEYHKFCGPSLVDCNGDPIPEMIAENSPFWDSLTLWLYHGKRVDVDGFCILTAAVPPILISEAGEMKKALDE
jgi:hypothetical protein